MRILITGGAGFIGSHLAERRVGRDEVVVLDNFDALLYDPARKRRNVAPLLERPDYRLVEGDIRDEALLERVFARDAFDQVVHIAALGGVRPSISDPGRYVDVNVRGTLNILEAMQRHGVPKLVFASSSSVYGVNPEVPWSEEGAVLHPISPYAATKLAGELLAHTFHHLHGLDVVCLRFFTVYGPRQRPDMAISSFTRRLAAGEPVPLYGDGFTARDYTFIDDIVAGVESALARSFGFEVINLGNSVTVRLDRLVEVVAGALGVEPRIEHLPPQPGDVPVTCADTAKARRLLDYVPRTPIEDGVARYIDWFRAQPAEER
jgi:UDP-glucuronate 4-epimerase